MKRRTLFTAFLGAVLLAGFTFAFMPKLQANAAEMIPESVTVEEESVIMKLGDEPFALTVTVLPAGATARVTWLADNPNVVAVDGENRLHALSEGTTILRMTSEVGNFTDTLSVTVTNEAVLPEGVTLDKTTHTGAVGETFYLTPSVWPENAENAGFSWRSSDTRVAIVNNGTVMLVGEGTCVITVRDDSGVYSATCTVTVTTAATSEKETGGCKGVIASSGLLLTGSILTAAAIVLKRRNKQ